MKFIKKIIFVILIILTFKNNVYAKTIFSIEDTNVNVGDEFTVKVNAEENPGFGMLGLKIDYDMSKLEYVDSDIEGLKKALMKNSTDNGKGQVVLYALSISESSLMKDNGTILKIKFKALDDGNCSTNLKINVTDFGVDESQALEYETKDAVITITGSKKKNKDNETSENVATTGTSSDNTKDVEVGNLYAMGEELKDSSNNITWKSSNENIATVDDSGNVIFNNAGDVTITGNDNSGNTIIEKKFSVNDDKKSENSSKKDNDGGEKLKGKTIYLVPVFILVFGIIVLVIKNKKGRRKK